MTNLITEIQIVPIKPKNGLVGFASCIYNNQIYLGSIGIMTRPRGGYRLMYPTKKVGNQNINIYYPINRETAQYIEKEIINKFEEITGSL